MFTLRIFFFLFVLSGALFANTPSQFKETRYSYALDKNISFEGFITFGEQNIVIEYIKPEAKVLTYFEEKLSIQDQNGFKMVDTTSTPAIHYFFMIIKAIHDENSVLMDSFFDQKIEGKEAILTPKGVTAEILMEVRIKRNGKKLESLHVKIKNGDRITIEIVD